MLQVLTTDEFAEWFAALPDALAEDVATLLDVVDDLGPDRAPRESREALLWYEHPKAADFTHPLAWDLEAWGDFRDYAGKVLEKLAAPRFKSRLSRLTDKDAGSVLRTIRHIQRIADPRMRWASLLDRPLLREAPRTETPRSEIRRLYFEALETAGFAVVDVPVHGRGLREIARRGSEPFRLLYGVDVQRETALFVLGERLDRSYYGDSVRRAERMWDDFLNGRLRAEPAQLR